METAHLYIGEMGLNDFNLLPLQQNVITIYNEYRVWWYKTLFWFWNLRGHAEDMQRPRIPGSCAFHNAGQWWEFFKVHSSKLLICRWFSEECDGEGRAEIDETQELNYPAIMKAIVECGYKGFVGQEFVPKQEDKIASLEKCIRICDV